MKAVRKIFGASLALALIACAWAEDYDLILANGRVVDGTGKPAFVGDVALKDGRIAKMGTVIGTAKERIDVKGAVIAPGFIDVHTHADDVWEKPRAENFLRMGVTSIVVGNCGGSEPDIAKFFHDVETRGVSPNVATFIGHNTIREKAMKGIFDRVPSKEEMADMKAQVDAAMKAGAIGFSTGLIYLPGAYSKTDELVELTKVITPYDGIYASHMRSESGKIFAAIDELLVIAREAKVRAELSHIKLSGEPSWGQSAKVIAMLDQARASGVRVTQDQYTYTASSTSIRSLIPDEAFDGGREKFLSILNDPVAKAKLVEKMKAYVKTRGRVDYAYAVIASFRGDVSLNGMNIVEAAQKLYGSDSLENQVEVILEIEKRGGAQGVFHGMQEEDLQSFMKHSSTMFASDSGIRDFGQGVPHPRGYGNNARVLARYVRELKVITLEDAVRKMTSLPARSFGFEKRGELAVGNWADIAVFDPEKVSDPASYKEPHHYAKGFPFVVVNGLVVVREGEHTGASPGVALKGAGVAR
ncbi:N-acyl-D-amino-acid deacylase family protein [Oleiharenicola lentus]|uniref:N-acyl-D-amino-acid deacylase family protein n=1 Tax=Oleiharenicola lentus TaxID=2508720 RepID=UPI003F67F485